MHELLGQSVPSADDCSRLRVDARDALRFGRHSFRQGAGLHLARAFPETRSSGGDFSTSDPAALATIVSLSGQLPSPRLELRRAQRVASSLTRARNFLLVDCYLRCLNFLSFVRLSALESTRDSIKVSPLSPAVLK